MISNGSLGLVVFEYVLSIAFLMFIVGGLSEEVDEKILHAAFIPFGDVTDINIPLDYETGLL